VEDLFGLSGSAEMERPYGIEGLGGRVTRVVSFPDRRLSGVGGPSALESGAKGARMISRTLRHVPSRAAFRGTPGEEKAMATSLLVGNGINRVTNQDASWEHVLNALLPGPHFPARCWNI
jgi:hypothetical protein